MQPQDGFEALDACHRDMLVKLGELSSLVGRLGDDDPDAAARAQAAEIVRFFSGTSRQHHLDEEQHIFPALLASANEELARAVGRLRQDHGWLEEDWLELEPQLDALASGQAWVDIPTLREGTDIFVALLRDHVALEESFIYPEARATMPEAARHEMGREMAARRRAKRRNA
ncbi:MAG TPA: hemerythrin domain-containing protein [Burkholderiaceae bacterium]|nr:hemerythrin domain-containing protein [Burkholderiaceae bacterium]